MTLMTAALYGLPTGKNLHHFYPPADVPERIISFFAILFLNNQPRTIACCGRLLTVAATCSFLQRNTAIFRLSEVCAVGTPATQSPTIGWGYRPPPISLNWPGLQKKNPCPCLWPKHIHIAIGRLVGHCCITMEFILTPFILILYCAITTSLILHCIQQ